MCISTLVRDLSDVYRIRIAPASQPDRRSTEYQSNSYRTSAEHHHKTAQELFLELEKKGAFIKKESEQYFDKEFNQFLADRYITGRCPKCGAEDAYGDQCEKCGSALSPTELINPVSILSESKPITKKTNHYLMMEILSKRF